MSACVYNHMLVVVINFLQNQHNYGFALQLRFKHSLKISASLLQNARLQWLKFCFSRSFSCWIKNLISLWPALLVCELWQNFGITEYILLVLYILYHQLHLLNFHMEKTILHYCNLNYYWCYDINTTLHETYTNSIYLIFLFLFFVFKQLYWYTLHHNIV